LSPAAKVAAGPRRGGAVEIRALSAAAARGVLSLGALRFPRALGRAGCRARKREGDGATPVGVWTAREVLYRPDRVRRPRTALPVRPLRPRDGWCDAPADRNYNRRIAHPYPAGAERLWREDGLYDLIVVLGYNERPRVRGRGSAIFMHVAAPHHAPTAGCVAVSRAHLLRILAALPPRARLLVLAGPKKGARSGRFGRSEHVPGKSRARKCGETRWSAGRAAS